jgi:hypothetical protein
MAPRRILCSTVLPAVSLRNHGRSSAREATCGDKELFSADRRRRIASKIVARPQNRQKASPMLPIG